MRKLILILLLFLLAGCSAPNPEPTFKQRYRAKPRLYNRVFEEMRDTAHRISAERRFERKLREMERKDND